MDIQAVYMLWCTHLWHVGLLNLSPWVGSQFVVLGWESYLGQNVLSFWVESFKTVLRIVMFYKWLNQCWNWCNGTHLYHSYYFVGTGGVNYCTYYDTPSNYSVLELAPHAVLMYTTRYTLYLHCDRCSWVVECPQFGQACSYGVQPSYWQRCTELSLILILASFSLQKITWCRVHCLRCCMGCVWASTVGQGHNRNNYLPDHWLETKVCLYRVIPWKTASVWSRFLKRDIKFNCTFH